MGVFHLVELVSMVGWFFAQRVCVQTDGGSWRVVSAVQRVMVSRWFE